MADQHGTITGNELPNQGGLLGLYLQTGTTVAFGGTLVLPSVASSLNAANKQSPIKMAILGLAAETISVTGAVDGTNFSSGLIPLSATTGGYVASANLGNGEYLFPTNWSFTHYKFTKSSATNTAILAVAYNTIPKI